MSDGITFTVVGEEQLLRKLDRLSRRDARTAIRKGTRAGAKIITARAKLLAPVGGTRHTKGTFWGKTKKGGTLRRSIKTRATKRSKNYIGAVTTIGKGFFKGDTFYGAFVEFGWKTGKRRIGGYLRKGGRRRVLMQDNPIRRQVKGQHFLERAGKQAGGRALKKATAVMASLITRFARNG